MGFNDQFLMLKAVILAVSLKNNRCSSIQKVKRHKSSLMSGYVFADSDALVMQKVGMNVEYKVTEDCGY